MDAHGTFTWMELNTRNAEKAKEFYGASLGWTFEEMTMESGNAYYMCKSGDTLVGGIFTMSGEMFEGIPEHWFSYVAVDDVDARLKTAVEQGGTIRREPFDVPGIGRIAILLDSNGAAMGWMTPSS